MSIQNSLEDELLNGRALLDGVMQQIRWFASDLDPRNKYKFQRQIRIAMLRFMEELEKEEMHGQ